DNGIDRKSISETKRKDIFSGNSSGNNFKNKKNNNLETKKVKIETYDWKNHNLNIKRKNSSSSSTTFKNNGNKGNNENNRYDNNDTKNSKIYNKDIYSSNSVKKDNSNNELQKNSIANEKSESCNSHYTVSNSKHFENENRTGIKNVFSNFINRRKSMLFDRRPFLNEFQNNKSNETCNKTLTNSNSSSNSNNSSNESLSTAKIIFSSSEESLNKIKGKKGSLDTIEEKIKYNNNNNDNDVDSNNK
ncbi:hypothetical protein U3516DRAFT_487185, partial [Neocallimastix sp. 'constans']